MIVLFGETNRSLIFSCEAKMSKFYQSANCFVLDFVTVTRKRWRTKTRSNTSTSRSQVKMDPLFRQGYFNFDFVRFVSHKKLTRVYFKIKKHTPLRKLMQAYCDRQGLQLTLVRFRFDGNPVKVSSCVLAGLFKFQETDTPENLEMEDEDTIDVFQSQTGGFATCWTSALAEPNRLPLCYSQTHVFLHRPFAGSLAHKHEKTYLIF